MPTGAITLADVAARTDVLAIACTQCDRAGRYRVDTLIERYAPGFGIPGLLRALSADCPTRASTNTYDLCGLHCPDLPGLFGAKVGR